MEANPYENPAKKDDGEKFIDPKTGAVLSPAEWEQQREIEDPNNP